MRNKLLALGLGLLWAFSATAEVWQAEYGVARTFNFKLYNADGTLDVDEVDGGTEVSLSCNEGAETTATNDFADEGNFYSIALTAAELQCERVAIVVAATTTEVFFVETFGHASAFNETLGWLTGDAFARLGAPAGASHAADLLTIDNFVDDLESRVGTPSDFGSGTLTLAANLQDLADNGTAAFDRSTDSLQAIRDRGDAAWTTGAGGDPQGPAYTTVATAPSTTTITLTAAPNDDTQYVGYGIYIENNGDADDNCLRAISGVSSGTITYYDPAGGTDACPFTVAAGDVVELLPAFMTAGVDVDSFSASALANLFDTDSGETSASAVSGSVVQEIADLAAGGGLTEAGIADAVLEELVADHGGTAGSLAATLAAILTDTSTTLDDFVDGLESAIAALNDVSQAEVQTAAAAALDAEDGANFTAIPEIAVFDYIEQFACDSGDTDTCVDSGLGEADNFWRGQGLRSLSGTTAGMVRCIAASDQSSTDVTVVPPFPASLGTGTVQIVRSDLCSGVDPTYTP